VQLLLAVGVAALLFATTNIDDIFVLVAFFADPTYRPRQIVIGQFLGIGALTALSVAGSLLALVVPPEYIGLLGVLPFLLGARKLVQVLRRAKDVEEPNAASGDAHARVISVALVTMANGGDNIGAYVPVFATRTLLELIATIAVFLVMTAVWCLVAHRLVAHPKLGPTIRRTAGPVTPLVLMGIGVLIVLEAGSYRVFF